MKHIMEEIKRLQEMTQQGMKRNLKIWDFVRNKIDEIPKINKKEGQGKSYVVSPSQIHDPKRKSFFELLPSSIRLNHQ